MAEDRSMLDVMRGSRILAYSMGVLSFVIGVFLIVTPGDSISVVAKIAGVLIAVVGLAEAFEAVTSHRKGSYWGLLLLRGVINVAVGALLLFWPEPTVTVLVWVFGLDLLVTGVVALIASRSVPKEKGRSTLVFRAAVGILFGLVVMAWPDKTLRIVALLIGLQLVLLGLILVFSGWQLSRAEKEMA